MKISRLMRAWAEIPSIEAHLDTALSCLEPDFPRAKVARLILEKVGNIESAIELLEAFEGGDAPKPPRAPAPAEEKVWVYVMAVDHPGVDLVKVGISKHPHFRMSTLEKERGYNLYLAHTEGPYPRSKAFDIEQAAHQSLAEHRERGEWFECGAVTAAAAVRTCASGVLQ